MSRIGDSLVLSAIPDSQGLLPELNENEDFARKSAYSW